MGVFDRILRAGDGKKVRAIKSVVEPVGDRGAEMEALSDAELAAKTVEFRERIDNGESLEDLMVESFAVVREAATRVIGQRHYDVQLMGGAALHFGWVAEMRTGEGKTLTSVLPVYLNALEGKGVHVVTVNDYLASRDAEWMGGVHRFLGLDVGLVIPSGRVNSAHKREQYGADITYGTNNEFGFDYLRDNMARSKAAQTQRGHNFCIVDEIDSILIDEARTPLIISGKVADTVELYFKFAAIARGLKRDIDYEVDEEKRQVSPTEAGIESVERQLGIENLYEGVSQDLVHQLNAALRAKELFKRDKDYLVQNGEVVIVDEFTGRTLEGRRWSDGLHQAVEAKEGVRIKEENQTLATVTIQNYFRLYEKLSGMTGTAQTEAAELNHTYGLDVVQIPTHKPIARMDQADLVYKTEDGKFDAVVADLKERWSAGQPCLVGTASVEKSELLSRYLTRDGIPHEVLNAKAHAREGQIVAQAGRLGGVTVATNMAGRGVDIILGGNPEGQAESDAIAEGLDPDSDEGRARIAELTASYGPKMAAEGEKVRELGGLYVLGTERHESRRIDNQLRGRSGRQGDPGESRFYLSLEDDLMRIFATNAMNWVMDRALPEDVPIESKMVTKSVERAQTTVEQRNAESRKNVLKYDEVQNEQRKIIYARREQILSGADLRDETLESVRNAVTSTVATWCVADYVEDWDLDGLHTEVAAMWPSELTVEDYSTADDTGALVDMLSDEAIARFESIEAEVGEERMGAVERELMLRLIDQKWREHLTEMAHLKDGINLRAMGQRDPLVEWQREGFDLFGQMMDSVSHDYVTYLLHVEVAPAPTPAQAGTPGAPSGGDTNGSEAVSDAAESAPPTIEEASVPELSYSSSDTVAERSPALASASATAQPGQARQSTPIVKTDDEKTPRNAPCPCGSGRKFKQCHGR